MKRIVIDADDRIIEVLENLCAALIIDGGSDIGDLSKRYDALDSVEELFDDEGKEIAWTVID